MCLESSVQRLLESITEQCMGSTADLLDILVAAVGEGECLEESVAAGDSSNIDSAAIMA